MLSLYVITAVVGGTFVLLSALGGDSDSDADHDLDHDHDFDHDVDHDFDHDFDHDVDHDTDLVHVGDASTDLGQAGIWLPFFSMRFWTYFTASFGVTGLALTGLAPIGAVLSAWVAGGTGLLTGTGMAYATRALKRAQVSSGVGVHHLVGSVGTVIVPIRAAETGKVRCVVRGTDVDLLARCDEDETMNRGAEVLVIGFDGHLAKVMCLELDLTGRGAVSCGCGLAPGRSRGALWAIITSALLFMRQRRRG